MGRRVPGLLIVAAVAVGLSSTGILVSRMATAERASATVAVGDPQPTATKSPADAPQSDGRVPPKAAFTRAPDLVARSTDSPRREKTSPAPRNTLPLKIRIEPPCAQRGSSMTATIESIAHAQVSVVVAYNDGHSHETYHLGQTDSDGKLVYTWVVHPQAAEGEGVLLAAVGDGERSATGSKNFTVAGPDGCG